MLHPPQHTCLCVMTYVAILGLAPTSPRLMAEYQRNDSGTNCKNSCDRSYYSYRNYCIDHIGLP